MLRLLKYLSILVVGSIGISVLYLWPYNNYLPAVTPSFKAERLTINPIISVDTSSRAQQLATAEGNTNINGPSLIRVPDWIENPLGKYYLYYAHHKGDHIRMAYADELTGPWHSLETGVLDLADSGFPTHYTKKKSQSNPIKRLLDDFSLFVTRDILMLAYTAIVKDKQTRKERGLPQASHKKAHLASPDVIIKKNQIVMFYHGLGVDGVQYTRAATSITGVNFSPVSFIVPSTYTRHFNYRGEHYLLGMPGVLYRSTTLLGSYVPRDKLLFDYKMRHSSVYVEEDTLHVFWSRVGDAPESILYSQVDLKSDDWNNWTATEGVAVLQPELAWEGASLPVLSSMRELSLAANELRDPYVFLDTNQKIYLLYSGAAEQAIGITQVLF